MPVITSTTGVDAASDEDAVLLSESEWAGRACEIGVTTMVSTRQASPETLLSLLILRRRTMLVTGRFTVVGTKAGRGGSPCLPPNQRIATTAADRAIVTPVTKVPTVRMSWNVTPPSIVAESSANAAFGD